jgi:hypothetical protein
VSAAYTKLSYMALFDFAYARRMEDEDDGTATFVVPSGSGIAVPVGKWIDLEHPSEVLSDDRLAQVATARAEAQATQA